MELDDAVGLASSIDEGNSAAHQLRVQLGADLGRVDVDAAWRYVDELPTHQVDGYSEVDLRLGVALDHSLELEVAVRDALSASHQEYYPTSLHSAPAEVQRSLRAGIRWRH